MGSNVFNILKNDFEKRQQLAFKQLEARKNDLFNKIPRLEEIEEQIRITSVRYNKMILLGTREEYALLEELLQNIDSLKKEKGNILISAGFPRNYLEPVYECEKCKDTGFVDTNEGSSEKCSCYKQLLVDLLFAQSNLRLAETENFNTFNENYFSDKINVSRYGIDISPRENILLIKEQCWDFIRNFRDPQQKNLFFSGPAGSGKTFVSNCIAYELLKQGATIIYLSAPTLFNIISEYRMKAFKDENFDINPFKNINEAELLIIDDLGTEPPSASKFSEFLNILNTRYLNNFSRPCKTIISSNIEAIDLYKYYQERITSRIFGNFEVYRFAGEDIRRIIKLEQ